MLAQVEVVFIRNEKRSIEMQKEFSITFCLLSVDRENAKADTKGEPGHTW